MQQQKIMTQILFHAEIFPLKRIVIHLCYENTSELSLEITETSVKHFYFWMNEQT